jgi:hypothetical protein
LPDDECAKLSGAGHWAVARMIENITGFNFEIQGNTNGKWHIEPFNSAESLKILAQHLSTVRMTILLPNLSGLA